MRIGRVRLDNGFFLAPMAGFTTIPFRRLCKEFGAGLTTAPLVSAEAIARENEKTRGMLARARNEKPFAIQIFGSAPKSMARAAELLEKKCDILDVNLGCPVRHVTQHGAGAALLRKPEKIAAIFDALASVKLPVTAKMRLGFGTKTHCVDIARLIERKGAAAVTVHGRTASQAYSKKPDLEAIGAVKKALSIPVIGNGGIFKPEDAEKMLEKTKCDAVMIGRGALGNPFVFRQMKEFFEKGEYAIPSTGERQAVFLKFLEYAAKEPIAQLQMQSSQFTKGLENAAATRRMMTKAKSTEEIRRVATGEIRE